MVEDMEKRKKLYDVVIALMICATILIAAGVFILKIHEKNPEEIFTKEIENIYNTVLNERKKDIEKDSFDSQKITKYFGTNILANDDELTYMIEFNKKSDEVIYFCISNGNRMAELEGEMPKDYFENPVIKKTNRVCEYRGNDER